MSILIKQLTKGDEVLIMANSRVISGKQMERATAIEISHDQTHVVAEIPPTRGLFLGWLNTRPLYVACYFDWDTQSYVPYSDPTDTPEEAHKYITQHNMQSSLSGFGIY